MADRPRSISNPLALAVLACLHERPMHPYEVAQTLRQVMGVGVQDLAQ